VEIGHAGSPPPGAGYAYYTASSARLPSCECIIIMIIIIPCSPDIIFAAFNVSLFVVHYSLTVQTLHAYLLVEGAFLQLLFVIMVSGIKEPFYLFVFTISVIRTHPPSNLLCRCIVNIFFYIIYYFTFTHNDHIITYILSRLKCSCSSTIPFKN